MSRQEQKIGERAVFYLAFRPEDRYNQRVNGVAWGGRLTLTRAVPCLVWQADSSDEIAL